MTTTPIPELKPCPFCGGEAQIKREYRENPNPGYGGDTQVYFGCQCGANGPGFALKTMASFTEYTVKDFRDNPALRAKEEERYEAYCVDVDVQAFTAWNTRAAIEASQPKGYQLVPIEPTDQMLHALIKGWDSVGSLTMYENYRAMLSAAPATPQGNL